jgi:hypothetical protein
MEQYDAFRRYDLQHGDEYHRANSDRVILLSDGELEPYLVHERTEEEFEIRPSAISFEDSARATETIYLNPQAKHPSKTR